jgi:hypothetical protein
MKATPRSRDRVISRPIRSGGSSGDVGAAHHCRLYPLPHCRASMIHAPLDTNQYVALAIT